MLSEQGLNAAIDAINESSGWGTALNLAVAASLLAAIIVALLAFRNNRRK